MSQEASNKNLMLSVLAAFREGDLGPLFAALSPGGVGKAAAPKEFFRFGGTYHGTAGMHEYTALLSSRYHFTRLTPEIVTATSPAFLFSDMLISAVFELLPLASIRIQNLEFTESQYRV